MRFITKFSCYQNEQKKKTKKKQTNKQTNKQKMISLNN